MPKWFHTHLPFREDSYYYLADAEAKIKFLENVKQQNIYFDRIISFNLIRLDISWTGHLEDQVSSKGYDQPTKTGNSWVCFHDITLRPTVFPPLGQPFITGDVFIISKDGYEIGSGVVTRSIDYTKEKRLLHQAQI